MLMNVRMLDNQPANQVYPLDFQQLTQRKHLANIILTSQTLTQPIVPQRLRCNANVIQRCCVVSCWGARACDDGVWGSWAVGLWGGGLAHPTTPRQLPHNRTTTPHTITNNLTTQPSYNHIYNYHYNRTTISQQHHHNYTHNHTTLQSQSPHNLTTTALQSLQQPHIQSHQQPQHNHAYNSHPNCQPPQQPQIQRRIQPQNN